MRRAPAHARRGRRRHTPCRSDAPTHEDGAVFRALARQGEHPSVKISVAARSAFFPSEFFFPCQRSAVFSLPVSILSRITDCTTLL